MRKLLLLIIILSVTETFAQHKPFQFGFKGGANMAWFSSDEDSYSNQGVNFGGSWGFAADIFLMENYSVTTGFDVLYLNGTIKYPDQKPHEILGVMIPGETARKYKTKYIELPVILTMKTNQIGKVRYFGQIGFGLGFLLSAKAEDSFNANDIDMKTSETSNVYEDVRFTRESLILGLGAEVPVQGSTYLRFGLKYDNAFVNILKGDNSVDPAIKNNGKNNFLEVNASFFF